MPGSFDAGADSGRDDSAVVLHLPGEVVDSRAHQSARQASILGLSELQLSEDARTVGGMVRQTAQALASLAAR